MRSQPRWHAQDVQTQMQADDEPELGEMLFPPPSPSGDGAVLNYRATVWLARLTSLIVTAIISRMVLRIMPGREMM